MGDAFQLKRLNFCSPISNCKEAPIMENVRKLNNNRD